MTDPAMDPVPEISAAAAVASRLCSACGMCCNGVMFHRVHLQPADSPRALAALGIKLKHKNGDRCLSQPCSAFCGSHCSIYAARPERCRVFACRQLERVAAGEITEAAALERIQETQRRVAELTAFLERAGSTDAKRPLSKRYEKALAEPLDATSSPADVQLRSQLTLAMDELSFLLDTHFRIAKSTPSESDKT